MKFKVSFPITRDMSPISYIVSDSSRSESKEETALWYYNNSRSHDGLPPLSKLPAGTTFTPLHKLDID